MIRVYHQQGDGTYLHVANVNHWTRYQIPVEHELESAWEQTNSIHQEWRLNYCVEMQTEGQHRSSMVGDVFVADDDTCWEVALTGFAQILKSIKEILEEAEDLQDARIARQEAEAEGTIPWEEIRDENSAPYTLVYAMIDACGCVELRIEHVFTIYEAASILVRRGRHPSDACLFSGLPLFAPYDENNQLENEWLQQMEAQEAEAERREYLRLKEKFEARAQETEESDAGA